MKQLIFPKYAQFLLARFKQGNRCVEVTQFMPDDDENEDVTETASRLRLQADIHVEKDNKNETSNLLQPIKIPKRRRSPITVQEWVASLPVHHILQREK